MKYALYYLFSKNKKLERGFTLVELVVVFSIIAIISFTGVAAYITYKNNQELNTAVDTIVSMFQEAKSRAQSQVKPTDCNTAHTLQSWYVSVYPSTYAPAPNYVTLNYVCFDLLTYVVSLNTKYIMPNSVTLLSATDHSTATPTMYQPNPAVHAFFNVSNSLWATIDGQAFQQIWPSSNSSLQLNVINSYSTIILKGRTGTTKSIDVYSDGRILVH